jgi:propanol-preferring alcohol dehydrogenase
MRAVRLLAANRDLALVEIDVPDPGPGQVLLRVGGAGACHSDLHIMEMSAEQIPWPLPVTLGHEVAGWVEATGPGVVRLERGAPVAVFAAWGCGSCRACRVGEENMCELPKPSTITRGKSRGDELPSAGAGLGADGGLAEFMLVPSPRLLVPLGDLDPATAAPLTDAGLTPYRAINRQRHRLGAGSTAVVIGAGGLGHMAVQLLKTLTPAQVVVVDLAEDKLAFARELGADHGVVAGAEASDEVRRRTRGSLGVDFVLDRVGADSTLRWRRPSCAPAVTSPSSGLRAGRCRTPSRGCPTSPASPAATGAASVS